MWRSNNSKKSRWFNFTGFWLYRSFNEQLILFSFLVECTEEQFDRVVSLISYISFFFSYNYGTGWIFCYKYSELVISSARNSLIDSITIEWLSNDEDYWFPLQYIDCMTSTKSIRLIKKLRVIFCAVWHFIASLEQYFSGAV